MAAAVSPDEVERLCATVLRTGAEPVPWTVDIAAVLATAAVTTVFQPVVHLDSGGVVGFEALSRGSRGSDLQSPVDRIRVDRDAGRLGDLDWPCRAQAHRAGVAAQLHPGLTRFVNVEPGGLTAPCQADLVLAFTD